MRITEKDIQRQCNITGSYLNKRVRMYAEDGIWFCAIMDDRGSGIAYVLTSRGSKREVYNEIYAINNTLCYMASKGIMPRY